MVSVAGLNKCNSCTFLDGLGEVDAQAVRVARLARINLAGERLVRDLDLQATSKANS